MICSTQDCAYCRSPIASGERWVRKNTAGGPHYLRYHADLFAEEALSCWEKHQMELEIARPVARAA